MGWVDGGRGGQMLEHEADGHTQFTPYVCLLHRSQTQGKEHHMTTRTIPQEYLAFRQQDDFGFSAIDETEVNRTVDPDTLQETIIVRESITQSSESIQRVEDKLDQMLSLYNDGKLGLEAERDKMEDEVKKNLKTLEQLIMPLLVNLMKNPEKEYIYWPNRTAKIQEQIDKVLTLTRG